MQPVDLAAAHRQLQIRNFADAVPLYLAAVNATPETIPAWEGLLAGLTGLGLVDKALAVVETRQQRFNDGLGFYVGSLTRLVASGFDDIAEALIAATPNNNLLYIVARYGAGVLALRRQQPKEAAEHLGAASIMAENFSDHFWPHPFLQKIIIEGRQFQDFATLDTLMTRDRAEVIADAVIEGRGIIELAARFDDAGETDAPFVICAGMNEPYLDRFGERAARAVAAALGTLPGATFHLHIIDPTPALDRKLTALRAAVPSLRIGLSTETYRHHLQGYGRASYYAAARFLRAPEIMAHYRKPLMIVDIDIARLAHVPHIMQRFAGSAYGCFEQRGQIPGNICHASMVTIGDGDHAARFADLTAKLIARRAATEPFWLLDQTSILVASRYLMANDAAFRMVDLADITGMSFDNCFASQGDAKEKQTMRGTKAMAPVEAMAG